MFCNSETEKKYFIKLSMKAKKMRLFNENEIDWTAYELGFSSFLNGKNGNPYEKETDEWYSWNKGWNAA